MISTVPPYQNIKENHVYSTMTRHTNSFGYYLLLATISTVIYYSLIFVKRAKHIPTCCKFEHFT